MSNDPQYIQRVKDAVNDLPRKGTFFLKPIFERHSISRAIGVVLAQEGYIRRVGKKSEWIGPQHLIDDVAAELITEQLREYHASMTARARENTQPRKTRAKRRPSKLKGWTRSLRIGRIRFSIQRLP